MSEFKKADGYLNEKNSNATATEKLDAVLNWLNDNREKAYHYGYGLPRNYKKPKKDTYLSSQDVLNVLDKLERDKMVRMTIMGIGNGNQNSAEHYCISLDGEVLLQDGGYTQKLIDERTKKDKVAQDLKFTKLKDTILTIFSVVAGVSTLGLLILGVLEYVCGN
ncbi:hypothetical protein E1J38_014770 [Seonamhaeicola sediminis]|uniref:Uncharacterized protein n=1 Tax=Seonamhaeicola sediminis TaxID=2528206 RepID=A0A562Y7R5_9FLAO|nr:hypothetical protein [Seonamhaeicola sediminis]TWO30398.1 hypothetical protein E1J38_014770 [Seonamhaeicola sediminis]